MSGIRSVLAPVFAAAVMLSCGAPSGAAEYSKGANDREIRIGHTVPYSGPASAYGAVGLLTAAYYEMINARGGVNGRKIRFISLDDAYNPAKTVEQTRKLVEQDDVFAMIGQVGTVTSSAVQKYLNSRKIPQLLIASGASKWNDPKNYPYSTALYALYEMEGRVFAQYLLKHNPGARVSILIQNDDAGRDYAKGFKDGLGAAAAKMVVRELSYETSDTTIDSQIVALKASGADTLFMMATPKFGAQAIRKIAETGWKPAVYLAAVTASIGTVLQPAGPENAKGFMSAFAFKRADDPLWANTPDVIAYKKFFADWYKNGNISESSNVIAYATAYLTVRLLERCGDNLTRENLLKQATTLSDVELPLLLPGIKVNTSPDDYSPIRQMQIGRFNGASWVMEGELISADMR